MTTLVLGLELVSWSALGFLVRRGTLRLDHVPFGWVPQWIMHHAFRITQRRER